MLRVASIKLLRARNAFPNPLPLLRRRSFSAAAPFERYSGRNVLADALESEIKHTQMISLVINHSPESELQMAFIEFLEVRGIKKSIAGFLYDYMNWKSKLPNDGVLRSVEAYSAEKSVQEKNIEMLKKLKKIIKNW